MGETSVPIDDGRERTEEPMLDRVWKFLDTEGPKVIEELKKSGELDDYPRLKEYYCKAINASLLVPLVNTLHVPGIAYTLQPANREDFKHAKWGFHTIGIFKLDTDSYGAFDWSTETDDKRHFFFESGTLSELSAKLDNRFGSRWDLDFAAVDKPEKSVKEKLSVLEGKIDQGMHFTVDDATYRPPVLDDKTVYKPLGLKYSPQLGSDTIPKIRNHFTYEYA